ASLLRGPMLRKVFHFNFDKGCRMVLRFLAVIPMLIFGSGVVAADRPNIVMILSDDQAWTDYGFMGHKVIATPHLDQLASESATFLNGYVPTSLCRPSLATLISGLYPHQHKITGNDPLP